MLRVFPRCPSGYRACKTRFGGQAPAPGDGKPAGTSIAPSAMMGLCRLWGSALATAGQWHGVRARCRKVTTRPQPAEPSMNRTDLVAHVSDAADLPKAATSKAVYAVFEPITVALGRSEEVALIGFGAFSVAERPARQRHNPKTGVAIEIPPSRAPRFKAGKRLKDAVRG
jgi:DNA-binding protein HU-beta